MRFRNTLILVAILALLGGYVYLTEIRKEERKPADEQGKVLFDLNPADIMTVTVRKVQENVEKLARVRREEGKPWQIEQPVQEPAYETTVNSLVESLAKLEATRQLEATPADLGIYGLRESPLEITITLRDGKEHVVLAGDMNPTKTGYFVQVRGDPAVYLVWTSPIVDLEGWLEEPPTIPTPTPSPAPTATPTSWPAVTPSPEATPTPKPSS